MSNPLVQFVTDGWPAKIAADVSQAERVIACSALSCQPPRRLSQTGLSPLWLALVSAAARGRTVVMILPATTPTHPATARNNTTAALAHSLGIVTHLIPMPRLLHAKTVLIDSRVSWIGSGNLTAAAASHNHEAWIRTEDDATAHDLLTFHHQLIYGKD